jgi:hypothetical protein
MAKDPAFLFYSKEFYEGTRTMLPDERACYLDLLMYQHQHGEIPFDIKRLLMYCSGISQATLEATLEAKFKRGESGYYNDKLRRVIADRAEYKGKQSDNGIVGQFFKKAKKATTDAQFKDLREYVYGKYGIDTLLNDLKKPEATHEALLIALLKHLSISISDSISIKIDKGVPETQTTLPAEKSAIRQRLDLTVTDLKEKSNTGEPRAKIEIALFEALKRNPNFPQEDVVKSYCTYSAYLLKTGYSRKALTAWLNEDKFLTDWIKEAQNMPAKPGEVAPKLSLKDRN